MLYNNRESGLSNGRKQKRSGKSMFNFIVTPRAIRGKKGQKLFRQMQERLTAWGGDYRIFHTQRKGHATELTRQLTEEGERNIVIMGGDGAVNDALKGLLGVEDVSFGIIPSGTGNDFAASAKIPHGIEALDLILEGEAKPTDYIRFSDGQCSMNIAGLGIDVDILIRCEKGRIRGKIKYFLSLLKSLMFYRGTSVRVLVDGKEEERKILIAAVANGKQFGGGIVLCPPAEIDDGLMELMVVDYPKRSKIPGALIKLMQGKILDLPFAHRISCSQASIFPSERCKAQYDGELYEANALEATLVKGGIKMYRK